MSNPQSKFKVGDHVRVTSPDNDNFDEFGTVIETTAAYTWPFRVMLEGRQSHGLLFAAHELTLADPDVHEVLAEMADECGLAAEEKTGRQPAEVLADWELELLSGRRSVILRTAGNLINGQRAKDYGDAGENFQRIADLWSVIIGSRIEPEQVALCMAQVKIARLITSPTHQDSWIDLAGYAALGGEITERRA